MGMSYEQGRIDAIELYGRVCSSQSSCEDCVVSQLKGDSISCQEFMSRFPSKMLSLLTEMDSKEYTYYNEYITRFPNCNLTLEALADIACRKAIFEGYISCEGGDCKTCWKEQYTGDITEDDDINDSEEDLVQE